MDFEYNDEQEALRDAVKGLLSKNYLDFEKRRESTKSDQGFDAGLWSRLAEMGVLGLPFSEDDGGVGAGPIEVGIVAEEMGRLLAPEPFLGAVVLAGNAVALAGSAEQKAALLEPLVEGRSRLAFAHTEPSVRHGDSAIGVTASASNGTFTLDGVKEPVLSAPGAAHLIVSAALAEGGTGLFVVVAQDAEVTGYSTHDGGRAARVVFNSTPAEALGAGGDATASIAAVLGYARLAAAHEMLGIMAQALTVTQNYLTSRKQFGVTLNAFQALNFRAADMYVSLELARSVVLWAAMVADRGGDDTAVAIARACLQAGKAARHIGQEAVQLHGGIGVTAEYSVGHMLSRLTALEHLFGDHRYHLGTLSQGVATYAEVDPLG